MALTDSFVFTHAASELLKGHMNLVTSDMRLVLTMTNETTHSTGRDLDNLSVMSLDEYDGTGYPGPPVGSYANRANLLTEAVNEDELNNRAEFDAADYTFTSLAKGTRQASAALVYKHDVTDDTTSKPLARVASGGFPFDGTGSDVTIQWNVEGIVQATCV